MMVLSELSWLGVGSKLQTLVYNVINIQVT
jgi:hypothetical protein